MSGALVYLKDFNKKGERKKDSVKIWVDDPEFEKTLNELKLAIQNGRKQVLKLSQIISEKGEENNEALMKIFYHQFGTIFKMLNMFDS